MHDMRRRRPGMAEYNADGFTLSDGMDTITFNASSGDTYVNDPDNCSGLDGVTVRAPVEDKSQTDGLIAHTFRKSGRRITLAGDLRVRSASDEAGFLSARNALEDDLLAFCEAHLNTPATLTVPRSGGATRTISVRCEILPTFPGGMQKKYILGLIAVDPDFAEEE
jgi:hypothetical protein